MTVLKLNSETKEYIDAEVSEISRLDYEPDELDGLIERAKNLVDYIADLPNYLSAWQEAYLLAVTAYVRLLQGTERNEEAVMFGKAQLDKLQGINHPKIGSLLSMMSIFLTYLGEKEEAINYLHQAFLISESFPSYTELKIHLLLTKAFVLDNFDTQGISSDSINHTLDALSIAKATGNGRYTTKALDRLTDYSVRLNEYDNAIKYGEECLLYYEQSNKNREDLIEGILGYVLNNLGQAWLGKEMPSKAKECFERGFVISKQHNNSVGMLRAQQGLGSSHLNQANYSTAVSYLHSARKIAEAAENKPEIRSSYKLLADALAAAGDHEQALDYFRRFHDLTHSFYKQNTQISYQRAQAKHNLEVAIELNEQLEESNRLLQRAYNEQDELLKIVAHDLRNPLSAVSLQLSLANKNLERGDTEKSAVYVSRSKKSIGYMDEIIDQLHELTLVEGEFLTFDQVEIDLITVLQSTIERNLSLANDKQISVELTAPDEVTVVSDDKILGQVFDNLLANGIKYSNPSLAVNVIVEIDKPMLLIHFVDNGVGMAADEIDLLFTKFGRLPSSRPTDNERSVGLGLYIAKKRTAQLNGKLHASSAGKGQGSIFTVELPLHSLDSL